MTDGGWKPRCDCGEPAEQTLVYIWDGTEERRRAVCPEHYRKACDTYADMKRNRPGQLAGFRMVTA